MTSTPLSNILKTPSTFQACSLDSISENSSKVPIISRQKLSTIFPPPKFTAPKEITVEPTKIIKTKCFNSQNILGFVLLNLLAVVAIFPLFLLNYVAFTLPDGPEFHENLIPGFNLTRFQLIGIFTFICVDLSLYLIIYYTAYYSAAFYGCSTDLHYKIFNGSQFIPLILIIKLLQPLAVIGIDQIQFSSAITWMIRILILLLLFVYFFPIFMSEIKFIRSIGQIPPQKPIYQNPLVQYAVYFKHINFDDHGEQQKKENSQKKLTAYVFFAMKTIAILFFLSEVAIVNLGSFTPLLMDYPLLISMTNLIYIFYSHKTILVKYNVLDTRRTALTCEFGCLDGRRCCNTFRPNQLMSYEQSEKTYLQPVAAEYNVYSISELPQWLKRSIRRRLSTH